MLTIGTLQIPAESTTWFDSITIEFTDEKDFLILNLKQNGEKVGERVIGVKQSVE